MNLYFHFFNKENNEYIKVDKNTSAIKTNLDNFNLKLFELESGVDLRSVTTSTLVIEKENKGVYYHYKAVSGDYDVYEKSFNFKNVKLVNDNESEKYRMFVDFKENGIVVYNTKDFTKEVFYKPVADDFTIDVHEAKRIDDVFELQNESDKEISFTLSVDTFSQSTTLQYKWWFDYNKESNSEANFEPLGSSKKVFVQDKSVIDFFENETFLHVDLKDVFGNVRKKSFKILAPGNTYSLFEIFNEPIIISKLDDNIKLFIDYRNCNSVRPVLEFVVDKTDKIVTSDKIFGEAFYDLNTFDIKLSELFENDVLTSAQKFKLSFKLNESSSMSKQIEIMIDNKKPIIKLSNLDEDNYLLIVDDKDKEQINGIVFDESLFFIGSESRKCGFEGVTDKIFIHSNKELTDVKFSNGKSAFLYSYGGYYLCEDNRGDFELYNESVLIDKNDYEVIRHSDSLGMKHIFMILEKSELSNYELNIVKNQGGLQIKGPITDVLTNQYFTDFSEFYFISLEIPENETGKYPFTVGISDFEYDFSKHFYDKNISCKITQFKELDTDFDSTRLVFVASKNNVDVIVFNDNEKLKKMVTYTAGEVSFCAISKKTEEFFTTLESVTFIDQTLNTLPFEKIHLKPKIKDENGLNVQIDNFTMVEIDNVNEKSYSLTFDVPVVEGENAFSLEIEDKTGQSEKAVFILEKNTKLVEFKIQETEMTDSEVFEEVDGTFNLVNNRDSCFVKIIIFNETRKEKKTERFLIVNNGKKTEKHRIQTKNGTRFVALYLNNSTNGENYSLSYNQYTEELMKINTKKQDELFLKVENNFMAGSNYYHLNYFKDDFTTLSLEYTNRTNFRCELHEGYIEITRTKNSNFIEELSLTLTVNDKNGNYPHISRNISGKFYNETVISDYYIEKANNVNGKIDEPMFDLVVKSQENENVLYMTLYDEAELNVYKRKHTAYYDSEKDQFLFRKITSPISPKSILMNIHLKGEENLILEKRLFENENIYYEKDNNYVLTSLNKNEDTVFVETYTSSSSEKFKTMQIVVNDNVFLEKNDVTLNTNISNVEKIDIVDLPIISSLYCKYISEKNRVFYSKVFNLDFGIKKTNVSIKHNFDKKLVSKKEVETLSFSQIGNKKVVLVSINSVGDNVTKELKDGEQKIEIFEPGEIYNVKLYLTDKNSRRLFYQNTIQVYEDISELLELKDNLFEKIRFNKTITIKNESMIESEELNCFLAHYVNGSLVKSYPPVFNKKEIKFNISKYVGTNKLILNYNDDKMEVSEFFFKNELVKVRRIYDITVDENVLYKKEENEFILTGGSDITLKTEGIRKIKINSRKIGRVMEKTVADNFTCRIRSSWLPCEIESFDENEEKINIPIVKLKLLTSNKFIYKNKQNKKQEKTVMKIKITSPATKVIVNSFKCKLEFYNFHMFYQYSNAVAKFCGNRKWLELEKIERNNIIKQITAGVLEENENKKIIKKFIGGK